LKNISDSKKETEWPTKLTTKKVRRWAAQGASPREIAENCSLTLSQLNQLLESSDELAEALSAGLDLADDQVESALFHRAVGFEYYSHEKFEEDLAHQGKNTGEVKVKEVKKKIKVLGEISAQIFWLKNRRPDRWRDKQELKHQAEVSGGIVFLPQVADDIEDWSALVIEHEQQKINELSDKK